MRVFKAIVWFPVAGLQLGEQWPTSTARCSLQQLEAANSSTSGSGIGVCDVTAKIAATAGRRVLAGGVVLRRARISAVEVQSVQQRHGADCRRRRHVAADNRK